MKTPFDAAAIHSTIQRALASAGLDTTTGPMQDVGETIRRALAAGGLHDAAAPAAPTAPARPPVRFQRHRFGGDAGHLDYKLHVPDRTADGPRPLLVMLHGCTQSADDFAAGTQMNRLADDHGCLVAYPEQAAGSNASRCWNWFEPRHQRRDAGEPALIAGIVREVAERHRADPRRIFVVGLSAGAAMAVVLGETYPELFAGVGAHSGLPYGSAHDMPSALAAMKGGRSGLAGPPRRPATRAVPLIVFHGDRDPTVRPANGAQIVQQALAAHAAEAGGAALQAHTQRGVAPGGRSFSRTVHADAAGRAVVESWTLHGAGHAWSGGHASGSYTDATGPDASAEMLRFFLGLPHGGSA